LTHPRVAESNRVSQTIPTVAAAHGPPLQALTGTRQSLAMMMATLSDQLVQ